MASIDRHSFSARTMSDGEVFVYLSRKATCSRCSVTYCAHVLDVIAERKDAGTIFLAEGESEWYFEVPIYFAWGISANCILKESNKVYLSLRHQDRFLCVLGPYDGRQTVMETILDNLRFMDMPMLADIVCDSVYHARNQMRMKTFLQQYTFDTVEYTAALITQLQSYVCVLCRETEARLQADTDIPEPPYVAGYPKRNVNYTGIRRTHSPIQKGL